MPQGDDKKSMWRDVSDQDFGAQGAPIESQSTIGPDTRGNWQRLKDYVAAKWREPAGMGSLDEPYRPGIGYGPTMGEVGSDIASEATSLLSPLALESKAAGVIASKLPQRIKAAAGGAGEGYTVGSGFEKMGVPYASRIGAVGGGLYGAITGQDPGMSIIRKAGEAWRGGATSTPPPSGSATAPVSGQLVVTPGQQAEDVGRFYAGAGPGGGGATGPSPYVTEENRRLLEKIQQGGSTAGENPLIKSLRRHYGSRRP